MSDIRELKEPCDHGRYDEHTWSGPKTVEMNQPQPMDWCWGGKKVVLRKMPWTEFGESVLPFVWVEEVDDD